MKVIDRARLGLREGASDKLYEADLVEVIAGQFVVNFRFGRRGAALRDGTKTAVPVPEGRARAIFAALVAEKSAKGYQPVGVATTATPSPAAAPANPGSTHQALLHRLWQGHRGAGPLLPVIRRVGELGVRDAEPILLELLAASRTNAEAPDVIWRYTIVAALARCGSSAAVPALERLPGDGAQPDHVRDLARLALAMIWGEAGRDRTRAMARALVPPTIAGDPYRAGPTSATAGVEDLLARGRTAQARDAIIGLYLLDDSAARAAVLSAARGLRLAGGEWPIVRMLIRGAELRRDGELSALLARRIEDHRGATPCGPRTRAYFRRRIARVLRRLGQQGSPDFVAMAVPLLLGYRDDDAGEVITGAYGATYDRFARFHALNMLLYARSSRYQPGHHGAATWRCAPSYRPGGPPPRDREEAFGPLWDAAPEALWHLVRAARAEPVVYFATRALRDQRGFVAALTDGALAAVLADGHPLAQRFAFEAVRERPLTAELARAALASSVDDAHDWVLAWVERHPDLAIADPALVALLITGPSTRVRDGGVALVRGRGLTDEVARSAATRALAILLGLSDTPEAAARAAGAVAVLLRVLGAPLRRLGADVLRDLIEHPLAALGELAGELILAHEQAAGLPTDLATHLLASPHPSVRALGARVLAQTPPEVAKGDPDALVTFALSGNAELRAGTRALIGEVARRWPEVGRAIADLLIDALLTAQPAGAPAHVIALLRHELAGCLPARDATTILRLCGALSPHARDAGGLLLPQLGPDELGLDDLVRLASHESVLVRQGAWALAEQATPRWKLAPVALARLCDASWDDSRAFAFGFVRRSFDADDLAPDAIIAMCDSVRPAVQDFGKSLLQEHFRGAHAATYLIRLGEHPAPGVQLLVSTLLDAARGDLARLQALLPYLYTVLGQVNRGGVAKQRVLAFVRAEATASAASARLLAPLLDHQSATIAITQKAPLIATMVAVHDAYPDVPLPIAITPARPHRPGGPT